MPRNNEPLEPIDGDHHSSTPPSLTQMAFGDGTPRKAFYTALVVGTILISINHGDHILHGVFRGREREKH